MAFDQLGQKAPSIYSRYISSRPFSFAFFFSFTSRVCDLLRGLLSRPLILQCTINAIAMVII